MEPTLLGIRYYRGNTVSLRARVRVTIMSRFRVRVTVRVKVGLRNR